MSTDPVALLQSEASAAHEDHGVSTEVPHEEMPRIPEELSIMPLRGFVAFPGSVLPLTVTRPDSIKLLDDTLPRTKVIGLLTARDDAKENPEPQDLYVMGTAALVLKLVRQAD